MPHSHAPRQTLIGTARPDSPQPEQQEHEQEGPRFRREDEGRARTRRCACADAEQPELEEDGREPTAPGTAPGGGTRPGVWAAASCRRRCRRRAGFNTSNSATSDAFESSAPSEERRPFLNQSDESLRSPDSGHAFSWGGDSAAFWPPARCSPQMWKDREGASRPGERADSDRTVAGAGGVAAVVDMWIRISLMLKGISSAVTSSGCFMDTWMSASLSPQEYMAKSSGEVFTTKLVLYLFTHVPCGGWRH
ncbi:uncharacterized protein LOC106729438 isoform X2 [Camelus ferus]|uniref:Uncharacterized protein LOC106729438 isoform X2 n=1 Tax=Camelus ferus TaxID=419612 RepID=A0A8B8SKE0_CAMFR|nr:uncharacterized protein LOC106729438 isoform X2 [Camelus ferus]XP_032330220.1 uncharacterized protein LOC106729438 isoform X2 [Camelus ferus]